MITPKIGNFKASDSTLMLIIVFRFQITYLIIPFVAEGYEVSDSVSECVSTSEDTKYPIQKVCTKWNHSGTRLPLFFIYISFIIFTLLIFTFLYLGNHFGTKVVPFWNQIGTKVEPVAKKQCFQCLQRVTYCETTLFFEL